MSAGNRRPAPSAMFRTIDTLARSSWPRSTGCPSQRTGRGEGLELQGELVDVESLGIEARARRSLPTVRTRVPSLMTASSASRCRRSSRNERRRRRSGLARRASDALGYFRNLPVHVHVSVHVPVRAGTASYSSVSSTEIFSDRRNFLSSGVIRMGAGSLFSTLKSKVETSAVSRLPGLVEADGGLEDERHLVALGLDAVQAVGDLRGLGQGALDGRAEILHHALDVFAACGIGSFHHLARQNYAEAVPRVSSWNGRGYGSRLRIELRISSERGALLTRDGSGIRAGSPRMAGAAQGAGAY